MFEFYVEVDEHDQSKGDIEPMTYTNKLTIVIRDDAPLIHCNDAPSFRSVQIELTPEQMAKIVRVRNEEISRCFIEPHEKS